MLAMNVVCAPLTRPAGTLSPLGELDWLGESNTGRRRYGRPIRIRWLTEPLHPIQRGQPV